MRMRVRASSMLIVAVAMMGLASCDHYNCASGPTLGSSCTSTGSGLGTTGSSGGNGTATAAFVFVADSAGTGTTGTIDGYTLNTSASTFSATPSFIAPLTPQGDAGVGLVVAQKQFLFTGFGSTNTIYGWSIGADGSLTTLNGSPYPAPFMSFVESGFLTTSIVTNPAGTLMFFADIFQDKIYGYQIGTDGTLTAASGSPFSVPFAGNLATDGLGKYLYVSDSFSNHTGSQIAAYTIGTTGSLTAVPGSPFAFPMWQVQGEPSGQFLIGTTGNSAAPGFSGIDDSHLYVFNITQSGTTAGAIAPVLGSPFVTLNSPLNIAVQSNTGGNLVYTFGIADSDLAFNSIEGYAISSTGALTAVSGSPFTGVSEGSQGAFDQSGDFLFVYGEIFNSGTNAITFQLGALDVASGGVLSQPTSTLTLATGGFFAVTDPQ
jgi:6-phosphogluconolactonase